jgi:hypothetical protein
MTRQTRHGNEKPTGGNRLAVAETLAEGPDNRASVAPSRDSDPALLHTDREVAIALFWQADGIQLGVALGADTERRTAEADAADSWKALTGHVRRFAGLDPWPAAQEKRRRRQVAAGERTRQAAEPWPEESAG